MSSQLKRFLYALARDAAGVVGTTALAILGICIVEAAGFGVLYLLGWGALALLGDGPADASLRALAGGLLLLGGALLGLLYACIRDLRRWLRRHWSAAGREM